MWLDHDRRPSPSDRGQWFCALMGTAALRGESIILFARNLQLMRSPGLMGPPQCQDSYNIPPPCDRAQVGQNIQEWNGEMIENSGRVPVQDAQPRSFGNRDRPCR